MCTFICHFDGMRPRCTSNMFISFVCLSDSDACEGLPSAAHGIPVQPVIVQNAKSHVSLPSQLGRSLVSHIEGIPEVTGAVHYAPDCFSLMFPRFVPRLLQLNLLLWLSL